MEIRIRTTGEVMFENEFRALHSNTSFPAQLTVEILDSLGADPVLEGPQATPSRYQVMFRDGVQQIDGQWFTKYSVADFDEKAIAIKNSEEEKIVRATRNQKLKESDWTQLVDSVADKALWATYRQALRDIPKQAGFPWDIQWPQEPGQ